MSGEKPHVQWSWDDQCEVINKSPLTSIVGRAGPGLSTVLFGAPGILQTPWKPLQVLGELRVEGAITTTKSNTAWAALGKPSGCRCAVAFSREQFKMTEKWALVAATTSSTHLQELLCTGGLARKEKEDAEKWKAKKWNIPDYTPRVWRGGLSHKDMVVSPSQGCPVIPLGGYPKISSTFSTSHLLETLPGLTRPW